MKVNLQKHALGLRKVQHKILKSILGRWSPKAMTGAPIELNQLYALFESARWAPSASNNQPWHYYFAMKDTPSFDRLFNLLDDGNKKWCDKASVLLILTSTNQAAYKNKPIPTHSFDTGASWMALAIQGVANNLVTHAMAGFDKQAARELLQLNSHEFVECMIAVGVPSENISEDKLSDRRALTESVTNLEEVI